MDGSPHDKERLDLVGDAQILLTAPFFPSTDPLDYRPTCRVPEGGTLDSHGRLVRSHRSIDRFLRGSLTYGNPKVDVLLHFAGTDRFRDELTAPIRETLKVPLRLDVTGVLFPDGYGSVAARIEVPDGWTADFRLRLIDAFGPSGRDQVASDVRDVLLPALAELSDRCCPEVACETLLPYFNLVYVAATSRPRAGRTVLPDELRHLVYPRSPAPITSDSPWSDEFFYAGYAFSLLASPDPRQTLDQLEYLLLHLDVLFARMERTATAADQLIRGGTRDEDIDWLVALERRLRADYQALVRPTFTYDYHVLKLRDSLLNAWEIDKARERTETLLQMARQTMERRLAQEQAQRVSRVNLVITILTILGFVSSADAAINLLSRLFD